MQCTGRAPIRCKQDGAPNEGDRKEAPAPLAPLLQEWAALPGRKGREAADFEAFKPVFLPKAGARQIS